MEQEEYEEFLAKVTRDVIKQLEPIFNQYLTEHAALHKKVAALFELILKGEV